MFALLVVVLAVYLYLAVLDGRVRTRTVALTAGGIAAAAALTRPDGAIYLAVY